MTTTYSENSSEESRQAVAKLAYACSVAAKADYCCAYDGGTNFIPNMLIDHFGIDPSCTQIYRNYFTTEEWENIIRKELDEGRPVLYSGTGQGSAHGFICDGYDETGLYHINWGFEGLANGYYDLATLNPEDMTANGFLDKQAITYGIKPLGHEGETVYDNNMFYDAVNNMTSGSVAVGGKVDYDIIGMVCNGHDFNDYIGSALYDAEGNMVDMELNENIEIPVDTYYDGHRMTYTLPQELEDGGYTLRPISGVSQDKWQPMDDGKGKGSVTTLAVTVENGMATVANGPAHKLSLSFDRDVEVEGGAVYAGRNATIRIPIKNNGSHFNNYIYVKNVNNDSCDFYDNMIIDADETVSMNVPLLIGNDTAEQEYVVYFEYLDGKSDTVGTFTLTPQQPAEGTPQITCKSLTFDKVAYMPDEEIVAHITLSNSGGFYEGLPEIMVYSDGYRFIFYGSKMQLNKGEEKSCDINVSSEFILNTMGDIDGVIGTVWPGYGDPVTDEFIQIEGEAKFYITKQEPAEGEPLISIEGISLDKSTYSTEDKLVAYVPMSNAGGFYGGYPVVFVSTNGHEWRYYGDGIIINKGEQKIGTVQIDTNFLLENCGVNELSGVIMPGYYNPTTEEYLRGEYVIGFAVTEDGEPLTVDLKVEGEATVEDGKAYAGQEATVNFTLANNGDDFYGIIGVLDPATDTYLNAQETLIYAGESKDMQINLTMQDEPGEQLYEVYCIDVFSNENLAGTFAITTEQATGISTAEAVAEKDDTPVYTVSGLRVGTAADLKSLPKGIYITGGKKIIVK